jgi:surfeit locus 1 family protein
VQTRVVIAIACGVLVTVAALALGQWQQRRGDAKVALQRQWDAALAAPTRDVRAADLAALAGRLPMRVRLRGTLEPPRQVWLDNRQHEGRPGVRALMALRLDGDGSRVVVDRGWAPRDPADRSRVPALPTPAGTTTIEGLALERPGRLLELGSAPATEQQLPALWQNFDYERFERAAGVPVARVVVQQTSALDDGLVRDMPRFDAGVERHRGYAVQWYALAVLAASLTAVFGWRAARVVEVAR